LPAVRVPRDGQIVALRRSDRKDVRIVREKDIERAGLDQPVGSYQIVRMKLLIVHSGEIDDSVAESKNFRPGAKELDANPAGLLRNIVL